MKPERHDELEKGTRRDRVSRRFGEVGGKKIGIDTHACKSPFCSTELVIMTMYAPFPGTFPNDPSSILTAS